MGHRNEGRGRSDRQDDDDGVLRIDCSTCVLEGSAACGDCVVTFLIGRERGEPLVVRPAEVVTLQALAAGGLAPVLRHRPRYRSVASAS